MQENQKYQITALNNTDIQFTFTNKQYVIRNLPKLLTQKLNIFIRMDYNSIFHLDSFNFLSSSARERFIDKIIKKFNFDYPDYNVIENEMNVMLDYILQKLEDNRLEYISVPIKIELTEKEKKEAIRYVTTGPDYLDKAIKDMDALGFVGEKLNKQIALLVSISRKLNRPLSAIIKSRAASGKSKLMEMICGFTPDEDLKRITRLTPQALYYQEKDSLKHKLLSIEEQEGMSGADYVVRALQSSNELVQVSTIKDPTTGKLTTTEYKVEGPMSVIMSTTKPAINFENETRCFILSMDESEEQTKRIFQKIAELKTKKGFDASKNAQNIKKIHQNFQRTLKPVKVFNSYSEKLLFPTKQLQTRRLRNYYEGLIEVIAFINQHKKTIHKDEKNNYEYIEVSPDDIKKANELMSQIMQQSLHDLSNPSLELMVIIKNMLEKMYKHVTIKPKEYEFSRKEIRDYSGWSDYHIKTYIKELVDLEYIKIKGGKQGKRFIYELSVTLEDFRKYILSNVFNDKTSKVQKTSKNKILKLKNQKLPKNSLIQT